MWYPEDESFKLNKDSNFYNRGDMFLPTIAIENTPVADEYLSEAVHYFLWNKTGEISGIYSILNTSIVAYRATNAQM